MQNSHSKITKMWKTIVFSSWDKNCWSPTFGIRYFPPKHILKVEKDLALAEKRRAKKERIFQVPTEEQGGYGGLVLNLVELDRGKNPIARPEEKTRFACIVSLNEAYLKSGVSLCGDAQCILLPPNCFVYILSLISCPSNLIHFIPMVTRKGNKFELSRNGNFVLLGGGQTFGEMDKCSKLMRHGFHDLVLILCAATQPCPGWIWICVLFLFFFFAARQIS